MEARPIEARGLARRFGAVQALAGLSLTLGAGEALGLLGPNGAGKSTALSLLTGLRAPDAGEVRLFGHPPASAAARARFGVTPQAAGFPDQLTPAEVLGWAAARRPGGADPAEVVAAFGLGPLMGRRMAGFSGGEVRRVALALAFLGRPGLVFLDEPSAGLDLEAQGAFRAAARAHLARGGALVLTSHHWDEIEAVCDRIVMIDAGRPVLEGPLAAIRARIGVRRVGFALPEGAAPPDWLGARRSGGRWRAECEDADACVRRMAAEGVGFRDLTVEPLALGDVVARIGREGRA